MCIMLNIHCFLSTLGNESSGVTDMYQPIISYCQFHLIVTIAVGQSFMLRLLFGLAALSHRSSRIVFADVSRVHVQHVAADLRKTAANLK